MAQQRFLAEDLLDFATKCFVSLGVPEEDAMWTAHVLVTADLQSRATHGISRLAAYAHGLERSKINPTPDILVTKAGLSSAAIDANNALGPIAAKKGMDQAIACAKESGIGAVTVRGANHAGAMGIYTSNAADEGLIAFAFTNAQPAIPPWGGRQAYFGTNPIAMSVGTEDHQITIDLATSVTARGNIIMAAKAGEPIPEGWALDAQGVPTTDAKAALNGSVLPMAEAKGYSLALMVEVLAGVLSGAAVGAGVGSVYDDDSSPANTGMFFMALNPAFFLGMGFEERLKEMEREIHQIPLAHGAEQIYLPGERRRIISDERKRNGIPLTSETIAELRELAKRCDVDFPTDIQSM